jgi:hypothetical protein
MLWRSELCTGYFAPSCLQDALTFEPVEVFGEGRRVCAEVVPFEEEEDEGMEFVVAVEEA